MKMFVISDSVDTRSGMRLVGVQGVVNNTREEVLATLDKVFGDPEVAIVLITFKLAAMVSDFIDTARIKREFPLIVEIPDTDFSNLSEDKVARYIKESIGLTIDES